MDEETSNWRIKLNLAISQCLVLEKTLKAEENKTGGALLRTLAKPEPFTGQLRSFQPKDEGGETRPREDKKVVSSANDVLRQFFALFADRMNITATKDLGNAEVKRDVFVDGVMVLEQVPPTLLLTLKQKMEEIHGLLQNIHTLPAEDNWTLDANTQLYRSEPDVKASGKKVPKVFVKAEATEKHPAQVEVLQEDVTVGFWTTIKLSSALPLPEKQALLTRVSKVIQALKMALEDANQHRLPQSNIGDTLAKYLLG